MNPNTVRVVATVTVDGMSTGPILDTWEIMLTFGEI